MTVDEALARVHEWERDHGHSAELALASLKYRWDLGMPRLTEAQHRDGAERWLDYRAAKRNEERQRRLAEAERTEAFAEEILEAMRRADG
jgi:hypothetical protein